MTTPSACAEPDGHFDVLIVGAGLSGIGAAAHLQRRCPRKRFTILEAREAIGGTWDLFRYPGVRSDSDMYTLGYAFKPWTRPESIVDGASIRQYIADTAAERGIDRHIRFGHRVVRAGWSSAQARWTVEAECGPQREPVRVTCGFLYVCSGYYSYAEGHRPAFPGEARFGGRIVEPQFWPEDLDYRGRRVVVIGSGATAMTLVPAMARDAAHVTMLQRSPTYVVALPSRDPLAARLGSRPQGSPAYRLVRWKNILLSRFLYRLARRRPEQFKRRLVGMVRDRLGPDYDVATHFTPRYKPWDQRVCVVPDADLFEAIEQGRASVVTDRIDAFTERGIRLASGAGLDADIVVAATGLKLNLMGDVRFEIDGEPCDLSKRLTYKAAMLSDVPNLAYTFGYVNASWTLKADLVATYVCRLLNFMDAQGFAVAVPRRDATVQEAPFFEFTSGYVQRALDMLPRQGSKPPWTLQQDYLHDLRMLRLGRLDDGTLKFSMP